ncbi:RidA family protein [Novosphingobium aquimarinum]|uniref:RidA family protein n=1 Tax=Novosphingobium aquimarinum TaxID=2682494 RepID=UPI0012EC4F70|nr:RidA family protein [Novosphingobium aquimarinum]
MADIQRIAGNPRMSMATVHAGTCYLSGQVAIDNRGGPAESQVAEILARIDSLLAQCGSDRSRLLSVQVFIADLADMASLNEAWDKWLPSGCAPARTTIQATLASDAYRLEIAVIAATS